MAGIPGVHQRIQLLYVLLWWTVLRWGKDEMRAKVAARLFSAPSRQPVWRITMGCASLLPQTSHPVREGLCLTLIPWIPSSPTLTPEDKRWGRLQKSYSFLTVSFTSMLKGQSLCFCSGSESQNNVPKMTKTVWAGSGYTRSETRKEDLEDFCPVQLSKWDTNLLQEKM